MSLSQLEARLSALETEVEGLKDEAMYLRAILADLIYSAIKQDKFNPEFLVKQLQSYKHAPNSWISCKEENPAMYVRHLSILKELADAIFEGVEVRNKPQKDAPLATELAEVRLYLQQELTLHQSGR